MIWTYLLVLMAVSPVISTFLLIGVMRAEARPRIIIREDLGFGGEWK